MALLDDLSPASYKGATFLVSRTTVEGGRKDQKHEFPNSDKQNIEDLGLRPRTYNIVGFITGDNYKQLRDRLLFALESDEPGVLSHPFYGEIQNIKSRSFSLTENLDDLGAAEISMIFDVSDIIGVPDESENTLSLLNASNDAVQSSINSSIADNFKVDTKFTGNFGSAKSKLNAVQSSYEDSSNIIVRSTDKINEFNALVSDFGNNVNELILQPKELADSITNIGEGLDGLYSTAEQQLDVWKSLFGFGDNDTEFAETTTGLVQRQNNNNVMNNSMQIQSLSFAYLAGAQIDYGNTDDLDDVASVLELQFQKVMSSTSLDHDVNEATVIMRANANSFFDQLRLALNKIITVTTAKLPARVIAYQYYGAASLGAEIADLNKNANVSFLENDIQVLTA